MISVPLLCPPEPNIDFPGDDIGSHDNTFTWQQCAMHCRNNKDCKFWAWLDKTFANAAYKCMMKNKLSREGRKSQAGVWTGSKECFEPCQAVGTDYIGDLTGSGITNVQTWQDCSIHCRNNGECKGWTWVNDKHSSPGNFWTCWLRRTLTGTNLRVGTVSGPRECVLEGMFNIQLFSIIQ